MTPKEKAKELFMRFSSHTVHFNCARSCALIAVDEILLGYMGNPKVKYWTEVKQELNKLSYDNIK
jgi:hypothetical protein